MSIDWTKPVINERGEPCLVLCTDASGSDPVWLRADALTGGHYFCTATLDGRRGGDHKPYFRNVPEKFERVVWVNVLPEGCGYCHSSREAADAAMCSRIACIKTTITGHVGQFDE